MSTERTERTQAGLGSHDLQEGENEPLDHGSVLGGSRPAHAYVRGVDDLRPVGQHVVGDVGTDVSVAAAMGQPRLPKFARA